VLMEKPFRNSAAIPVDPRAAKQRVEKSIL
jgi:hypothetical protein